MPLTILTKNGITGVPVGLADGELAVDRVKGKLWVGNGGASNLMVSEHLLPGGSLIGGTLRWQSTKWEEALTLQVAGNGNVNVGDSQSSPSHELVVNQTTGASSLAIRSGDSSQTSIYFGDSASTTIGRIQYNHSNNSMNIGTNSATRLSILTNGNVGINDVAPARRLSVMSTQRLIAAFATTDSTDGKISFADANTAADNTVFIGADTDDMILAAGGVEEIRITASGETIIHNELTIGDPTDRRGALFIGNDVNASSGFDIVFGDDSGPGLQGNIEFVSTGGNNGQYDPAIKDPGQLQLRASSILLADNSSVDSGFPIAWLEVDQNIEFATNRLVQMTLDTLGRLILHNVPTSDPAVSGMLWRSGTDLKISV